MTFPDGEWLDYWDNRIEYRGGQTVRVAVPEERRPMFVRRGCVIPLSEK
jgi:alpha-glucosidase (family GH31 glycosyl hydrolase)